MAKIFAAGLIVACGSFFLTTSVQAGPRIVGTLPVAKARAKNGRGGVGVGVPMGGPNVIPTLDQAYGLLRTADHDYKGHRARAMHNIEAAVRELGARVSGDGRGKEKQGASDTQVRDAQSLLAQVVGQVAGKAHTHVEDAIKQLGIALSVR